MRVGLKAFTLSRVCSVTSSHGSYDSALRWTRPLTHTWAKECSRRTDTASVKHVPQFGRVTARDASVRCLLDGEWLVTRYVLFR